jgi:heat shock protein HtpX
MWEQIRSNRRKSVALVVIIALLLTVLGYVIGEAFQPGAGPLGVCGAIFVWLIMALIAYFQGDNILLAVSGASEIEKEDHPQLFNVVEEMTIAGGLGAMPRVFILDDMALNAFATGRNPKKSAVAVTAGLLGRLNRDELQGVIAHEMSHIVNRDVLFMTMVGVMLGSIAMISEIFLRGFAFGGGARRYRSSRDGGGQAQAIMMIAALLLAILAPIIAQLIYFAISRRREYLADANAAVLTRYPEGLASALDAISNDTNILERANKVTAPMYISNPFRKAGLFAAGLTSTHPPIEERIKILRTMGGAVSFRDYDAAWRAAGGREKGVIPQSALAQEGDQPPRAPRPEDENIDPKRRMREAGDLLRKVNQFVFLPCACGLRLKLPPDFKQAKVACPRCGKELEVPLAKIATATQAGAIIAGGADANIAGSAGMGLAGGAAPLRVAKPRQDEDSNQRKTWRSFKCACGNIVNVSPANLSSTARCSHCGKNILIAPSADSE